MSRTWESPESLRAAFRFYLMLTTPIVPSEYSVGRLMEAILRTRH